MNGPFKFGGINFDINMGDNDYNNSMLSLRDNLMFWRIGNSAFGGTALETSDNPLSNCSLSIVNLIYLYLLIKSYLNKFGG